MRNALAVIACAKHCGLKNHQIQSAFDTFKGIKRRMEVRGIAGGVTVVDDFGHHPTAIRETLKALRLKYPHEKIWAIFEPRSNTTRRNVFQSELAGAFADADAVVVAEVARLEQIAAGGTAESGKIDAGFENRRQGRGLFAGCGFHCRARGKKRAGRRHRLWCSATAASAGFTANCWSGSVESNFEFTKSPFSRHKPVLFSGT